MAAKSSRKTPHLVPSRTSEKAPEPLNFDDEIRLRAYELYEQRGRRDGCAEEDWLEAEKEVIARNGRDVA